MAGPKARTAWPEAEAGRTWCKQAEPGAEVGAVDLNADLNAQSEVLKCQVAQMAAGRRHCDEHVVVQDAAVNNCQFLAAALLSK
jgi:hypothetical protein